MRLCAVGVTGARLGWLPRIRPKPMVPPSLSSSDIGKDTEILPKMRCRRVRTNVECTLAQDLVGPICRLVWYAQ